MPFLCDLVDVFCLLFCIFFFFFFFSSRRRHTRSYGDWSSDVCSSDLRGRCFGRLFAVRNGCGHACQSIGPCRVCTNGFGPGSIRASSFGAGGHVCKIGRASCRERVWMAEGRGAVKRKKCIERSAENE